MKKKSQKISLQKYQEKVQLFFKSAFEHRTFIVIVIIGGAIAFALLRTRSFIDIPRNETVYNEALLQIRYKSIDTELLTSFSQEVNDQNIEVDSQVNPGRDNPFSE